MFIYKRAISLIAVLAFCLIFLPARSQATVATATCGGCLPQDTQRPGTTGYFIANRKQCPNATRPISTRSAWAPKLMLCMANFARKRSHPRLGVLHWDKLLAKSTRIEEARMRRGGVPTHTPLGSLWTVSLADVGWPAAQAAGENLAWSSFEEDAQGYMVQILDSPDHRLNLLTPQWTTTAIAFGQVGGFITMDEQFAAPLGTPGVYALPGG